MYKRIKFKGKKLKDCKKKKTEIKTVHANQFLMVGEKKASHLFNLQIQSPNLYFKSILKLNYIRSQNKMQNLSQNKHTSKESHKKNLETKLNKALETKKKLYKKERERRLVTSPISSSFFFYYLI